VTWRGREARATGTTDLRGRKPPKTSNLRWACRCPKQESTGRRQSVFAVPQKPQGSSGSPEDPPVSELAKDPGAPTRRGVVRHDAPGKKRERGPAWAKAHATARGSCASKGGSGVLEPWPWNQGGEAQVPRRARSGRPRIPQSSRTGRTGAKGVQRTWRHVPA